MATKIKGAPNFTLEELYRSSTANAKGIDNTPGPAVIANLEYLAVKVLQPIRDFFKEPLIVTSGYRCPALNTAVGSSKSSFHTLGCAADIRFDRNKSKLRLSQLFAHIHQHLPYTELIAEDIPDGWVHVAIQRGREMEKQLKYKLPGSGVRRDKTFEQIMRLFGSDNK